MPRLIHVMDENEVPASDAVIEIEGFVPSGEYRIAVKVFLPFYSKGTLFIVHGYEASGSAFAQVAISAAGAGFASVILDLPGHGRSDGEPSEIARFSDYGDAVADVAAACEDRLPRPFLALGHSAGALAVFDASLRRGGAVFESVMLVAPLTRTAHWGASVAGYAIARPFTRSVSYGDGGRVSLDWFGKLVSWRKEAEGFPSLRVPAIILLGGEDRVIDGRDARRLLGKKLPEARFEVFPWMGHHDIERKPLDPRIEERVLIFLESK